MMGMAVPTCPKCHVEMRHGLAMEQTYGGVSNFPGDAQVVTVYASGPGRLIGCLKCPACGFSRSMGGRQQQEGRNA